MTDDDDAAEPPEFSLTRDRVARVLAMLEAKHANGGLDAGGDQGLRSRNAAPVRRRGLAKKIRAPRRATDRWRAARPISLRRRRANRTHDSAAARKFRISPAMCSARMAPQEAALVDAIADGCSYGELVAARPVDVPAARKLALLVRPALIAEPGKTLVWSDWSAIEARVTPWLAASPGADKVLDIFRANDRDPTLPDIYTLAAADILHKDPRAITKTERAIGKVAVLALGFGGSVGALQSMALSYRISLDAAEARRIVTAWREANPWAREFWDALWDAALSAWELPGQITQAGRLAFVYRDDYLGGALFMALPSGRLLTYPRPRWREVDILDQCGKPTGEKRSELSFRRAHGRAKLWSGTFCENAVQAAAADLLRAAVTRIETDPALAFMPIRMTTHDEVVCRGRRSARRARRRRSCAARC